MKTKNQQLDDSRTEAQMVMEKKDDAMGMTWWNGMSQPERHEVLHQADALIRGASVAQAWRLWKANRITMNQQLDDSRTEAQMVMEKKHGGPSRYQKKQVIQLLAALRMQYRNVNQTTAPTCPEVIHNIRIETNTIRRTCIPLFSMIENLFPGDMWTHLPDEKDLTDDSTIGDHLSVTRRTLGLTA